MLYLNKQHFVQNIDFPSLIGRPCKNTFVDGCLQFYLTQKDFSVNMRPNGACKNTSAPLCFFAQNLPCVTVIDANFAYVYKFLIQKQFAHGFRGIAKILLRRLFASAFIWKFIFGLTFAMRFQVTARQAECQFYRYRRPTLTALASSLPTASITVAYVFSTTGELEIS